MSINNINILQLPVELHYSIYDSLDCASLMKLRTVNKEMLNLVDDYFNCKIVIMTKHANAIDGSSAFTPEVCRILQNHVILDYKVKDNGINEASDGMPVYQRLYKLIGNHHLFPAVLQKQVMSYCDSATMQLRDILSIRFEELKDLQEAHEVRHWLQTHPQECGSVDDLDLSHKGLKMIPIEISCFTNLHCLSCQDNRLTSIPHDIFQRLPQLERIYLSENQLTSIPHDVFQGLPQLEGINLSENQLTSIPHDVFQRLPQLKWIDLSENQLTSIPHDVFQRLPQLKWIDLSENQLTSIPHDVFQGLPQLEDIHLSDNQLTSIPHDVFQRLPQLERIYLSKNKLESIPHDIFQKLPQLEHIYLIDNQLTSIPHDVFQGLQQLQMIHLSKNQLTSIPHDVFQRLPQLYTIDLSENQLTSIPHDVFQGLQQLQVIHLSKNQLTSMDSDMILGNDRLIWVDFLDYENCLHMLQKPLAQETLSNVVFKFFKSLIGAK